MKKTSKNKAKERVYHKIEDYEAQIAFAEAGELYSGKKKRKKGEKGTEEGPVCVEGETSSGLCIKD